MIFKLLACEVLTREIAYCIARCPHAVNPVFTAKGEHDTPAALKDLLQRRIDEAQHEDVAYDAILLGYGLCGNAVLGLTARDVPLVIPRAHDCTTLFLGSKEAFHTHFEANPSQAWASVGYSERGDTVIADSSTRDHLLGTDYAALVEQYGEENAAYIAQSLRVAHASSDLFFLDVPETHVPEVVARIRAEAAEQNLPLRVIAGSLRLIEGLVSGQWPDAEFLTVPPGHRITALYDWDRVVASSPAPGA